MMLRLLLALFFTLGFGTKAMACSCSPWQGGLVSEFVGRYTSFWGVPVQSEVKKLSTNRPRLVVVYEVEVIEGFDRIVTEKTEVISSIEDGGSCGIQLTMGVPQFLSAYKGQNGQLGINSCTPHLPYKAIKEYLEFGVDAFIPKTEDCFDKNMNLESENTDCLVWKDVSTNPWIHQGREDWLKYSASWRETKMKTLSPR